MDRLLIRELVARYRLEPKLRDIYVEGKSDRDIVRWLLLNSGCSDFRVFEATLVDVPTELLKKHSLTPGEKARLLALAEELAPHITLPSKQVTCVVDSDCDRILRKEAALPLVLTTDYTCMEMYFFNEPTLNKYFTLVLGAEVTNLAVTMAQYAVVLKELFLIRAAIESLGMTVAWIDFVTFCSRTPSGIQLNRVEFVRNLLQSSAAIEQREALMARAEDLRLRLGRDARQCIHGHDFLALLVFDKKQVAHKRGLQNIDAVTSALRGCVDPGDLAKEKLFTDLVARLSP